MKIGHRKIGPAHPPFIIAELSGNHGGKKDKMLSLVDEAKAAGGEAIKLQTYTADTLTIDSRDEDFMIRDAKSLWKENSLYELYEKASTPWDWHKAIFDRATENGLISFSTPFDVTAVDFLNKLNVPAFKIASFEILDLELIAAAAKTKKPLIISTGLANLSEIEDAVRTARDNGCVELALLKCTSSYPAAPSDSNLLAMVEMGKVFDCVVGLSDHSVGLGTAIAAVALGASIIEKHFNHSRDDGSVDAKFSMEPKELEFLMRESRAAWESLGRCTIGPMPAEKGSLMFRRSLYVTKDIEAGQPFTRENVRSIRPGLGLAPKHLPNILGKTAARTIRRGTRMSWDLLK